MRVPEYFWFDPFNPDDWSGFFLQHGVYQPILFDEQNRLISQTLGLTLQLWRGNFKGIETTWLRWTTLEGSLLLTSEELERQRADRVELQLQQTAINLLQEGMTIEQVARLTGLSQLQIEQLRQG